VDQKDLEQWNDFMEKIKEGMLFSFFQQFQQSMDDARRLDSQRLLPGWNYCQYFLMKEACAYAYELIGLYDLALVIYDELEAHFFQSMSGNRKVKDLFSRTRSALVQSFWGSRIRR
jgi:hypothetical protein